MFSRLIIIISCISLVGVTVLPASLIPCCCKSGVTQNCALQDSARGCCTGKMMSEVPAKTKSCCAKDPSDKCCSQKVIKKECPNCRCLEQLQIITLPGHNDNEHSIRISALAAVGSATTPVIGIDVPADIVAVKDFGGIPLSLQTCTLRC